jgi:hypothetical protein
MKPLPPIWLFVPSQLVACLFGNALVTNSRESQTGIIGRLEIFPDAPVDHRVMGLANLFLQPDQWLAVSRRLWDNDKLRWLAMQL